MDGDAGNRASDGATSFEPSGYQEKMAGVYGLMGHYISAQRHVLTQHVRNIASNISNKKAPFLRGHL